MTDRGRCDTCGSQLEGYRVYDPETGQTVGYEVSCPEQWRAAHE